MNTTLTRLRRAAWLQVLAIAVLTPSLVFVSGPALANPTGGVVTHGAAEIGDGLNGHLMINQLSNRAVINWESFNISAGEMTQFVQPGQNAIALSKVMSGSPSAIYGQLSANGGHILVNPNGILVGPGGRIDVGGLNVLSTLDIDSNQFMRGGPMRFTGNTTAGVTNFGTITSAGGDVILLGNFVDNQGKLGAVNGTVALGAGGEILLEANGEHTISILRGGAGGGTGVNNAGTITGAAVEMKAHGNVYALAVNNSGAVRATGGGRKGGRVILSAPGGSINNTGTILAKKANGAGGEILIDATGGDVNIESGEVRADGSGGRPGGSVTILGDSISVGAPATVSANGGDGGSVIIGSLEGTSQITIDGNVEAIGSSGAGGTIQLLGTGSSVIDVNGNLDATGSTTGGTINVSGGQFNQGVNSVINASGGLSGGSVIIDAAGVNTLGGIIEARGEANEGGNIQVTGDDVTLRSGVILDASGELGGGNINVGGGFQGRVDSIPNATTTTVEQGVNIKADANFANDGGTVVVWADGDTFFAGDISAQARGFVGNGGLIEVSGKENLKVRGTVSAMSVNGQSGAVLFDPGDVVVGNFTNDPSVDIDSETINTTLQGGTSVIIATESGDITFLNTGIDNDWHDAIQWTNSNASFGAFASGLIDIETHIRTSGAGSINIMAGWTGSEADLTGFGYAAGADPQAFENPLGIPSVEIAWKFFLEAGQFGDTSNLGSVIMGHADASRHIVVGSRYGNTNIAASSLFMVTPQGNTGESDYVHLGFRDTGAVFQVRGNGGFENTLIDLNDRLLERNNDPIVGINDPQYYRDVGGDGIPDGVYAINSGGVLDETNAFGIANPGGADAGPATLIPFANHFMSERFGNYWWQQIDGLSADPRGLGGLAPEHGAGRDPNVTFDPTSRADINIAVTGGVLLQSGGRHQDYAQVGHGGDSTAWGDDKTLFGGTANLTNQSSREVVQNGAGNDRTATGIGRLAGVFGNINVLTGLDPTTVRYDPSAPEINLTGVTDNPGGYVRLESWQNTASSNNLNNPEQGNNSESYTQIGHLGAGNFGWVEGDINVTAGGNIDLLAGAHTRNHATIGHTMNGFTFWNPPANEHQQIRFMQERGDTDNPNLRKGELFLHANGVDNARGFYADNNDPIDVNGGGVDPTAGRHDNDFWDIDGDLNNDGLLDSDDITPAPNTGADTPGPGVTGTAGENPNGPVHVPGLVGGTRKDLIGDIRVNSYGDKGITIAGFSNPDTRLITIDDSQSVGDLINDTTGAPRADPTVSETTLTGARGGDATDDGTDDDGLRRRTDRKFAGIGHGGSGFAIWNDNGTEQIHLRVTVGDTGTPGPNPGETLGNLASASATVAGQFNASRRNRAPTFINIIGNIDVHAHNGGVAMEAGNDTYDYAYIGHGGNDLSDLETANVMIGDINVTGADDLTMLGSGVRAVYTGESNRSSRSQVQIGHHGVNPGQQLYVGDINVDFGGDITMVSGRLGRSPAKIGHQTDEGYGQVGGTMDRLEHFIYGPQIDDVDPDSATGRALSVAFGGAVVTDSTVTITFGDHDQTSVYDIDGNTANIDVKAGGNILMTHPDPQLEVTQNMYARQQGTAINEMRWSNTSIGHGGRVTYAFRTNSDNLNYWYKDKTGDINVQAGSYLEDANGNTILDGNGLPTLEAGTGDITLQNGAGYHRHTNIGHYFEENARSNAPDTSENAYRLIGDINVNAYNNLTMDSSFGDANDPVNIVSFIGDPVERNYVRIGHGAGFNNLDVVTLDDGQDVNGIVASSDIDLTVGNDFNMGWLRTGDGAYETMKQDLEDRLGVELYGPDDDPRFNVDDETYGGFRGTFSQVGHGYMSDVGNDPARPDGFNGDITVMVGNDMNMTAGAEAWLISPVLGAEPVFVEGHAAVVGHGNHQLEGPMNGDIGVYVGNDLTMSASQRIQTENQDSSQSPVGNVGNLVKIGHWSLDMDVQRQSVESDMSGDITVVVGNDLEMNGGTTLGDFAEVPTQFAFAQIGHSGPGVNGDKIGDIQVLVQNDFRTNDGINLTDNGPDISNANAYVMVGNGDWARDGSGFAGHNGTGPGDRAGDITILVGNSIDFDHTLIGHADPAVAQAETTIRNGSTFIGVSRNFPFYNVDPGVTTDTGNLVARNGTVFSSGFYGLDGELRIYIPQRENNLMELDTRLNEGFVGYLGTPTGAGPAVGGVSFADHTGGTFDGTLGGAAGRGDEIYLQPDLWWASDAAAAAGTIVGTPGQFPTDLAGVQGGSVSTVDAPGGIPSLILLSAGLLGEGTALDSDGLDYRLLNGFSGRGAYTIYYDAVEEVGTTAIPPLPPVVPVEQPLPTPPLPPNPGPAFEPFFVEELPGLEIPFFVPQLDIFALLGLVDAVKYDTWDRYPDGAFGAAPDEEGFYARIGLFGMIYGPGGLLSEEENISISTGNTLLDALAVLIGEETIGESQDELEEHEKRAARYRTLGKTYLIQYRQLINTGQVNRYNSANVFSGNGL